MKQKPDYFNISGAFYLIPRFSNTHDDHHKHRENDEPNTSPDFKISDLTSACHTNKRMPQNVMPGSL